jgi:hypothetical protein
MTDFNESSERSAEATGIRKVLIISQIGFFSCIALCYLINHGVMADTDGISFYGVNHATIEILIVGYVTGAMGLWRLAHYFRSINVAPHIYLSLRLVALCLFGLLVTPYNKGAFLNWSHMTIGTLGALLQLEVTFYLMKGNLSVASVVGFLVQLVGGLICAASLPDWHFDGLLLGEILFQIGFSWSLLVSIRERGAAPNVAARPSYRAT